MHLRRGVIGAGGRRIGECERPGVGVPPFRVGKPAWVCGSRFGMAGGWKRLLSSSVGSVLTRGDGSPPEEHLSWPLA